MTIRRGVIMNDEWYGSQKNGGKEDKDEWMTWMPIRGVGEEK